MSERDQKIIENLKLVNHILQKQFPNLARNEDMFQIGCVGLIKAVDTFNEDAGISFSTYASKCIMNEILMELRKQQKQVSEISMETVILSSKTGWRIRKMSISELIIAIERRQL